MYNARNKVQIHSTVFIEVKLNIFYKADWLESLLQKYARYW